MSEEKRFTMVIRKNANSKIKDLEEDLTDILSMPKYSLAFFFKGEKIGLGERLGDREIGQNPTQNTESDSFLLCLKGGSEGPKTWKRFLHVDDPCR